MYRRFMDSHILAALEEDIPTIDHSAIVVADEDCRASARLICKQDGVIAGLGVFERVFQLVDSGISWNMHVKDGQDICRGQILGVVEGPARGILSAERTALNYLQRMSGIATYTRKMVSRLAGANVRLADTRKTTPGMRLFEKEAVRVGGGVSHRENLSECIMLKDNHVMLAGGVGAAVFRARRHAPFTLKIEVEVESVADALEAADAGADIIMLDNMSVADMRRAVNLIDGRALVECSGNVTLDNVAEVASTGVDVISSGALTHSAGIVNLSLKEFRVMSHG
ncbi:MAG: carboxylating nicotinate-nucleotide diphosphorylase [Coriobacteriales bacterium]